MNIAKRTRSSRTLISVGLALSALLSTTAAFAEASATQKAAAEALFQKGVQLMASGKAGEACPKFESSQELEPALGTLLRLADCYETVGKTASAWATFQQAASTAGVQSRGDREAIAIERVHSLEARLTKLELSFVGGTPGSELRLNGLAIPSASWDAALPVDPGSLVVELSAPDHRSWSKTVEVPLGPATVRVELPKLSPTPRATAPSAPAPSATPTQPLPAPPPAPSHALRNVGFVVGALGIGGLAVSGVFGAQAYTKNQDSLEQCRKADTSACTADGVSLREDARSAGSRSTIAGIAGGVLVAAGITLVLIPTSRKEAQRVGLSFVPSASPSDARFTLRGRF